MTLAACDTLLKDFSAVIDRPLQPAPNTKLYTGVDLGTAYIVLAVVDENGTPVGGALEYAEVVKDGLVLDYAGAVKIVKRLKADIEQAIGCQLLEAGVAYPPGTGVSDSRAIKYVAEAAGFEVIGAIDEPTAANQVMQITDGAIVDIGGGTTGTAVFADGKVIYIDDDPTGGTQFTLVVAGGMKITFEAAEREKKDPARQDEIQPLIKPVMEKVATIIRRHIAGQQVNAIYLVGGTSCNKYIDEIIALETGLKVYKPINPFLVTPLGIALYALRQKQSGNNSR